MKINYAVLSGDLVFIDFSHRFLIDHINLIVTIFVLWRTQSEESIIVRPRVKIANRNPWYDKMRIIKRLFDIDQK